MTEIKTPTHAELCDLYRRIPPIKKRGGHHTPHAENHTRLKRALTWLERCEKCNENEIDEQFLFLWISFNAAYGDDGTLQQKRSADREPEHKKLTDFLRRVAKRDDDDRLIGCIRANQKRVHDIMNNRFLFRPFWQAEYQGHAASSWQARFKKDKKRMHAKLHAVNPDAQCIGEILRLVFDRLYTLRNQIVHGGAQYCSDYNRSSLQLGHPIIALCVPEILHIMLTAIIKNPDENWGKVAYPPYLEEPDIIRDPPRRGRP